MRHLTYSLTHNRRRRLQRLTFIGCCLILLCNIGISTALTSDDLYSINTNTAFYDPTDTCSGSDVNATNASLTTSGSAVIVPPGQDAGTWNSGLQKPYILEQFMIELLKDIAKKRGVPASDAVTQQHVIALLAFAWGEGASITNNDLWNPFNTGPTGKNFTDLIDGAQSASGLESFKSFDAGVEATARVMTGDTQGRLGVTLVNPNSTAIDFVNSLMDFSPLSQGHYPWAQASDPSAGPGVYESNYKQARLSLVAQATRDYDSMASIIMRTSSSDSSDPNKQQHDTSKLQFHANGTSTPTAVDASLNTSCGTTGSVGGSFADKVRAYAWPTYHSGPYCLMMPAYATAIKAAIENKEYVGGGFGGVYESAQLDSKGVPIASADYCTASGDRQGIDCGGFVTRVYRDSKADPHYNSGNGYVPIQYNYVSSHPNLYEKVNRQKSGDLLPGDIYFEGTPGSANWLGHTYLVVGKGTFPDQKYDSVSASVSYSLHGQSWRTPMASVADDIKGGTWYHPLFPIDTTIATGTLAT